MINHHNTIVNQSISCNGSTSLVMTGSCLFTSYDVAASISAIAVSVYRCITHVCPTLSSIAKTHTCCLLSGDAAAAVNWNAFKQSVFVAGYFCRQFSRYRETVFVLPLCLKMKVKCFVVTSRLWINFQHHCLHFVYRSLSLSGLCVCIWLSDYGRQHILCKCTIDWMKNMFFEVQIIESDLLLLAQFMCQKISLWLVLKNAIYTPVCTFDCIAEAIFFLSQGSVVATSTVLAKHTLRWARKGIISMKNKWVSWRKETRSCWP